MITSLTGIYQTKNILAYGENMRNIGII